MSASAKNNSTPANTLRRKRQVKGRRNDKRVDVYLSPQEKETIQQAAERLGVSVSQYCASVALERAKADLQSRK